MTTLDLTATPAVPTVPAATTGRGSAVRVDQLRYLAGSVLTAGVAVLTALLGIVVAQGVLHLHAFAGTGGIGALPYVLGVVGVTLGAAVVFDAALHIAPHPTAYFSALTALGTALAVALPFTTTSSLPTQAALAVTNVVVGLVIVVLVPLAADNARR